MSEKRIHRAKHDTENPYYIASRQTAQDKSITYDALGLLNYVLSKPDDWVIQPSDLEREKCKRGKVYSILKELIKSGYIERVYHRDDKQRIVMVEYVAHEMPVIEKPLPENPEMGKQYMGKQHTTEYRGTQSTEHTKESNTASDDAATQPIATAIKETPAQPNQSPQSPTPVSAAPPPKESDKIVTLIKAYLDASGTIKPAMYANKTIRSEAKSLSEHGITPYHISTYIKRLRQDEFWKGKEIKWAKVCGEIIVHFKERPLVTTVFEPEKPIEPIIEGEFDPTFDPDAFEQLIENAAKAWEM